MPRTDKNQVVGPDGTILSETIVQRPVRVVSDARFAQVKAQLQNTNAPMTLPEIRSLLVEIVQYLTGELDGEPGE